MAAVTMLAAALVAGAIRPAPAAASNDEYFPGQWALSQIGAPQAWTRSTGAGVVIGIVDTGADLGHPDLAGKVAASANCVGRRPCQVGGGQDDNGHGTIVSGIASAVTGNGTGVAGAAPDARLVVAKALDSSGSGTADDIRAAVDWVVSQGARVVNLSLGEDEAPLGGNGGVVLRAAIEAAWARGAVPVLASGNQPGAAGATGSHNYGSLNALVVGATDRYGSVASYSSAIGNAKWGLVAPGGAGAGSRDDNVYSTGLRTTSNYVSAAGTSMAAPHVSAAIALLLAQGLSPSAAVSRLLATLNRTPCGPGCQGRLDMAAAVDASSAPPETVAPPPTTRVPTTRVPTTRAPVRTVPLPTTTTTVAPPPVVDLPFVEPAKAEVPAPLMAAPRALPPKVPASQGPGSLPGAVAATLVTGDVAVLVAVSLRRRRQEPSSGLPTGVSGW